MRLRQVAATFWHTESDQTEQQTVTCLFSDRNEKYVLTKVFVVEHQKEILFDKETNTFLVPD